MNIKGFAKCLMDTVDSSREYDNASDEQVIEDLINLLDILEPKDRSKFAKWGVPENQTTPEDCWG